MKEYGAADTACVTPITTFADLKFPAVLKVDEFKYDGSYTYGYLLKTCAADKMVLTTGVLPSDAASDAAPVITVVYGDKLKDGYVTCIPVGMGPIAHVSFTIKGFSKEAAAEETSGAMSLASTVAAGALAVAATQF